MPIPTPDLDFAFVADDELRLCLAADYRELGQCVDTRAWKSALVLAGSIAEALLVDALLTACPQEREEILKLELGPALDRCRAMGLVTQKTGDLCSVVKSFRNLIHPGRQVRLAEKPDP